MRRVHKRPPPTLPPVLGLQTKPKYKMRRTPNRWHPPPTAQTAGPIGLIFSLGVNQRHRIGVTVAIFEFPSQTLKNGLGPAPSETQKNSKKFFFEFFIFFDWNMKRDVRIHTKTLFEARFVIFSVIFLRFWRTWHFLKP